MKKIYSCTKKYLESLGVKNIITGNKPMAMMNGKPTAAKTWVWDGEEEFITSDFLNDTVAMEGVLYMYDWDSSKFCGFLGVDVDPAKELSFIDDPKEADKIWLKLYE